MFGIAASCTRSLDRELRRDYQAHMCGVCLALRDDAQAARGLTNRDAIALSLLVEAQSSAPLRRRVAGPCPLRGMATAEVVVASEPAVGHAAALSLLAGSVALVDHALDRDGLVGAVPGTAVRVARRCEAAGRRRADAVGFDVAPVLGAVGESWLVEVGGPAHVTDWSAPTEEAFAAAFAHTAHLASAPQNEAALAELGRMVGRLTVLLDAWDDVEEDRRAGRRNPLTDRCPAEAARRELAREVFDDAIARARAAFDRLDLRREDLVRHVLIDQVERQGRRRLGLEQTAGTCRVHHGGSRGAAGRLRSLATLAGALAWLGTVVAPSQNGGRRKRRDRCADCCDCCCCGCDDCCCDC